MTEFKAGWYWVKAYSDAPWECSYWNGSAWKNASPNHQHHEVGPRIPTPDEDWVTVPKEATIDMQRAIRTPDSGGQDHWAARVIKRIVDAAPRP